MMWRAPGWEYTAATQSLWMCIKLPVVQSKKYNFFKDSTCLCAFVLCVCVCVCVSCPAFWFHSNVQLEPSLAWMSCVSSIEQRPALCWHARAYLRVLRSNGSAWTSQCIMSSNHFAMAEHEPVHVVGTSQCGCWAWCCCAFLFAMQSVVVLRDLKLLCFLLLA